MKKTRLYFVIAALLGLFFLTSVTSFGMGDGDENRQPTEKEAQVIVMGILSPNAGVSQSCIYYSGKYKINQSMDILIGILNDSGRDNYTRTLAALSLGRIGGMKSFTAIKKIADGDKDGKLKMVCEIIYKEYYSFNESQLSAGN